MCRPGLSEALVTEGAAELPVVGVCTEGKNETTRVSVANEIANRN